MSDVSDGRRSATYGLDPADFGPAGISLYQLLGVAIVEPGKVVERGSVYGRGGGQLPLEAWQLKALVRVLTDHGVDVNVVVAKVEGAPPVPPILADGTDTAGQG